MKTLVVIEKDKGVIHSLDKAFERFVGDKLRVDYFETIESFESKYFSKTFHEHKNSEKPEEGDGAPIRLRSEEAHPIIDFLILAEEFLGDKPLKKAQDLLQALQKAQISTEERSSRIIVTGYYSEDLHLEYYESPMIIDFLFKPIDQQLFLQKLEIAFHLGKKVEPSYLAKAAIKEPIAIGKLSKIEEISEFGLAIRNPKPIRPGQFARFYSKIFFCKDSPSLLARCYLNIPHPQNPHEFMCYFSFFGIRREQLLNIRKQMLRDSHLQKSYTHAETVSNMELVDNSEVEKDIVVIDNDNTSFSNIKEVYSNRIQNVKVHHFPNYSAFLRSMSGAKANVNLLDEFYQEHQIGPYANQKDTKKKAKDTSPTLQERYLAVPMGDSLILEVKKEDLSLTRVNLFSEKRYDCFGYSFSELKTDPALWQSIIHELSKSDWEEFLGICMSGQNVKIELWGISKDSSPARIKIAGESKRDKLIFSISDISLNFKPADLSNEKISYHKIYAVYMDGSLFRAPYEDFANNLRKTIRDAGFKPDRRKTKIIPIGLEAGTTLAHTFEKEEIDDFFYRPLDRNLILQKLMIYVFPFEEELSSIQLEYFTNSHSAVLSTFVHMFEVSEHGIAIRYKIPFKEGSFMRFISNIFYMDNGDPLIGRCYYSEVDPSDANSYISYFEFFGVTDEVFKRIRVWIRENYIQNKAAS